MEEKEIKEKIKELEGEMQNPLFWQNKIRASEVVKELTTLKAAAAGENYDDSDAIITIFSGAGGDDAEDFSRILVEMYFKYAARQHFATQIIHQNENDHGGYRNITFQISGRGAYGQLKHESGVHRLVRISPFSAKKLRHTSFSLVEVLPRFPKTGPIEIPPEEIKVEFARSSGPGGQNVNKRETAVRITHLPTGLTVHSEEERSQAQNREKALEILRGKLFKFRENERQAKNESMYVSKTMEIEWGNQIRSYVFHPYKLIKDHRTGVEERDIDKVLEGNLDALIEAEKKL